MASHTQFTRANMDLTNLTQKTNYTYRGTVCKGTVKGAHVVMTAQLPYFLLSQ